MLPAESEEPAFLYKIGLSGFGRGEAAGNFSLSDAAFVGDHGEGRFIYRIMPYLYWHPTDYFNLHVEGQGFGFAGGANQDSDKYSLYQGFADVRWPGSEILSVRLGRQEFNYGSGFILGNDEFNDGLSFDAVQLRIKPIDPIKIDLLAGSYAKPLSNGVDGNLAGIYATYSLSSGNDIEAYFFRDTGSENHRSGEKLYVWGSRFTVRNEPISVEFEPVYESGLQFNENTGGYDRISAYGGHFDLNVESALQGFKNTFILSYAYGSGSRDAANGSRFNREFRNPNNYASFLEYISVVGDLSGIDAGDHHASGLQVYTLGWGVDLSKRFNFAITGHYYQANNVEEGFSRNLGLETNYRLTWNVLDSLSVILSYDRFFTGGFFRDAGASGDVDICYLMAQFDISSAKPVKGNLPK
ncbi:alginate export family protein [Geobacter sp. OR-1]|uniref:alginate export family protein n=1 Tax=Geobacter sp. OR-1 TaxID=1266765 RepID=UPI0006939049|nr:alginate export family protein [Geobacter sp. OR-1]